MFERNVTVALTNGGNVNKDGVETGDHKWTALVEFDQREADAFQFGAGALVTHAFSFGDITIDYDPTLGLPGLLLASTKIIGEGKAQIINPPLHDPETAYAEAKSAGYVDLTGTIHGGTLINGRHKTKLNIKGGGSVQGIGSAQAVDSPGTPAGKTNKGNVFDPVSLAYFDNLTGALIAEETLFQLAYHSVGTASVAFGDTGLILSSAALSEAAFSIATPSPWVLNGLTGSASIENGIFSATGYLAGLPWVVQTVSGVSTATLSPGVFGFDFDLDVEASGLGDGTNDLTVVLRNSGGGYANAYATVPEPGTFGLLGFGLTVLGFLRWRRFNSGEQKS